MIDWNSNQHLVLLNPRMLPDQQQQVRQGLSKITFPQKHFWIGTSGSSGQKWVALSQEALFASASAVNQHLEASGKDVWLNPLPEFHVGGLGIEVRAYLTRSTVVRELKWDVHTFQELLKQSQATLTALVPTQVYDLVQSSQKAPSNLRAIVVGGGHLSPRLYFQARQLGWNLLPSYGLTECASQVATASLSTLEKMEYPSLSSLSHVEVSCHSDGYLCLKSAALLTGYATTKADEYVFVDPKLEGWFETEDVGSVKGEYVEIIGRKSDFIKVGGENVYVSRLDRIVEELKFAMQLPVDLALVAVQDERLGHTLHLATNGSPEAVQVLVDSYNKQVLPFERIRQVHANTEIPRSPLGKLLRSQIKLL